MKGPPSTTSNRTAEFEYGSSEPDVTYECSLDGGAWGPCKDRYTVAPGEHTLHVRAVDGEATWIPRPRSTRGPW